MTCLVERIPELGKLCSGMSHRAAGRAFSVNEPTTYIQRVSEGKHWDHTVMC